MRLFLAACLCLASPALAGEVRILDGYSDFRKPENFEFEQPLAPLSDWIAGFPEMADGRPGLTLTSAFADGVLSVEITETGLMDDSVAAIQQRLEFAPMEDGRWLLTGYGFRQQCYRGTNAGTWTDKPCL